MAWATAVREEGPSQSPRSARTEPPHVAFCGGGAPLPAILNCSIRKSTSLKVTRSNSYVRRLSIGSAR